MAMVVRSNMMAYNANRQLGMNNSAVSKNLEKLSSGFKINRAADDASGLAISEKMKAQIKTLEQGSLNAQDGISLVQTAEGALTEIHDMLNRAVELATKSANGTIDTNIDRAAIGAEITQLSSEIDRICESTNFNGINLIGQAAEALGTLNIQVGDSSGSNTIQVTLVDMSSNGSTLTNISNLAGVITGESSGGADSAAEIDNLKADINAVSTQRAAFGALQNRLEHAINNIDVTAENMTNANSRIRDTDMAKQMMEYTKMNVLTQSAQAMLAQANQNPQSILQLLQ